jgi:hypothetical protein
MNKVLIILFSVALIASACNSGKKNPEYLTPATGKSGDIILIMDSVQWHGELGLQLRKIFKAEVPGLPRDEPMFNLIWVHPSKSIKLLTQIRNLIYVFTLDQKTPGTNVLRKDFTDETINKIKTDTTFYISTQKDEFSKGQEVMYLFGDTEQHLINHLKNNHQKLVDFFNNAERKRLEAKLFKTTTTKGLTDLLKKAFQFELRLPFGYKMAQKENDFVWLRQIDAEVDKDIFVSWKKYESEYQLLPDSLVAWRDAIAKRYLFEDPANPISYLVTETTVPFNPVRARQLPQDNRFIMELRGLWKTNNHTMGGPFISHSLVDQPKGLVYYIEGFAYSPGKDQRETMRELETIISSFKTSDQITK